MMSKQRGAKERASHREGGLKRKDWGKAYRKENAEQKQEKLFRITEIKLGVHHLSNSHRV